MFTVLCFLGVLAAFSILLCCACLKQAARSDEQAEREYRKFQSEKAMRVAQAEKAPPGGGDRPAGAAPARVQDGKKEAR